VSKTALVHTLHPSEQRINSLPVFSATATRLDKQRTKQIEPQNKKIKNGRTSSFATIHVT
jgi:hypothetical protein